MLRKRLSFLLMVIFAISLVTFTAGCGNTETATQPAPASQPAPAAEPAPSPEVDEAAILQQAAIDYFNYLPEGSNMVASENVKDTLGSYYIIDIRSAEDYAKGHVPGAVNIGMAKLGEAIPNLPTDKPILIYCYTGQTASQSAGVLKLAGFDMNILKGGFVNGWSKVEPALPVEQ